jgi:hypothetical protein
MDGFIDRAHRYAANSVGLVRMSWQDLKRATHPFIAAFGQGASRLGTLSIFRFYPRFFS